MTDKIADQKKSDKKIADKNIGSVFWHDVKHIIKSSWVEFTWITVLIGFLLFLLNIFLGVGVGSHQFSQTLQGKLGMYFYVVDTPNEQDYVYSQVIALKDELQDAGMDVVFRNKQQALYSLLGDDNVELINKFEEYGIGNPLPATLNVVFDSEQELLNLKSILGGYTDVITNSGDLSQTTTLQEQEAKNLTAINLGYVVFGSSIVIIVILLIGIVTFMLYMLKTKFANFHQKIEIKKILGAYYYQITGPFIVTTICLLIAGFVVMMGLVFGGVMVLQHYLMTLLSFDLLAVLGESAGLITMIGVIEFLLLIWFGWGVAFLYTRYLINRVKY